MARNTTKIDETVSRKAYSQATATLKQRHADEWNDLLDEAYAAQGVDSPRVRRRKKVEEKEQARLLRAQQQKRKEQEKIEAAKALLREAGYDVPNPEDVILEVFGSGVAN
jgi:hypothetical protein